MNFSIFYNLGALLHQCVTLMKRITSHHCIFTLVLWMHLFVGTRRLCNLCSNEYWLSNKQVIILSQHGPWRQAKQLPTHLISPGAPPSQQSHCKHDSIWTEANVGKLDTYRARTSLLTLWKLCKIKIKRNIRNVIVLMVGKCICLAFLICMMIIWTRVLIVIFSTTKSY